MEEGAGEGLRQLETLVIAAKNSKIPHGEPEKKVCWKKEGPSGVPCFSCLQNKRRKSFSRF